MLIQPQDTSFGTFFNLLNGYRITELMLVIRESQVMEIIGLDGKEEVQIIDEIGWNQDGAHRFISVLCELGFLQRYDSYICLSPFSRKFLHSESPNSQLRTLEFEPRLRDNWGKLHQALQRGARIPPSAKNPGKQQEHLELFLDAMDEAARLRATELWGIYPVAKSGTIMEIGAGPGTYLTTFLEKHPGWKGIFCDLPEVVERARKDESLATFGNRIKYISCDMLAPDNEWTALPPAHADLLLLSNIVHCQDEKATGLLLRRTASCLKGTGALLIHDFFSDTCWQGALYDFHMMANTHSGRTYQKAEISSMLKSLGLPHTVTHELPSFSSILAASSRANHLPQLDAYTRLKQAASDIGFNRSMIIPTETVPVASWVREKCKTGCTSYGTCASCPPNSLEPKAMKELLTEFSKALLIVGEPPSGLFRKSLIELEKFAFLEGYTKALAFPAGPCSICDTCHPTECRSPEKRRFSMEACGVDVFGLAKKHGIQLSPRSDENDYVQYIGMMLIE